MAIGAIIGTSLSYALQLSSAKWFCNAERFDDKAGPLVRLCRPLCVCNGKHDCMPTNVDRDQWTDVSEHRQENSWCCDLGVK